MGLEIAYNHLTEPTCEAVIFMMSDTLQPGHFDVHRMKPIAELAKTNPGVSFHVEHTGISYSHTPEGLAVWSEGIHALAAEPNVVCRLFGLGNTVPKWTEESIRPYVLEAIDIFGVDRCMFASTIRQIAFSARRALCSS